MGGREIGLLVEGAGGKGGAERAQVQTVHNAVQGDRKRMGTEQGALGDVAKIDLGSRTAAVEAKGTSTCCGVLCIGTAASDQRAGRKGSLPLWHAW